MIGEHVPSETYADLEAQILDASVIVPQDLLAQASEEATRLSVVIEDADLRNEVYRRAHLYLIDRLIQTRPQLPPSTEQPKV